MELGIEGLSGFVTTKTASRMLGVSTDAILWRIHKYGVAHLKVGTNILVSLEALRKTYAQPPRILGA